jgi:DNA polymerase elongation subunit (family B)
MANKFYTYVFQSKSKYWIVGYENGQKFIRDYIYEPYLFTTAAPNSKSPYRSITGQVLDRRDFRNYFEAKKYINEFDGIGGFRLFGSERFMYNFINDEFTGTIDYDYNLVRVVPIDIEVGSDETTGFPDVQKADQPVTAITAYFRGRYYAFGCGEFEPDEEDALDVDYVRCRDERDLLHKFMRLWRDISPDIVTGWYIEGFDIPYLYNRIKLLMGPEVADSLSPVGVVESHEFEKFGRKQVTFEIIGVSTLDYVDLYKKHSFTPQPSYKLDHIANSEIGVGKLDYSEQGSLLGLYKNNHQKFIKYNITDVRRVVGIDDKMKLIELVCALAWDAKVNFSDTFATVKPWDVIIHNFLLARNIVVPFKNKSTDREIMGGHVKDTIPGMYHWVVSFDVNSLYPSLIQQYNISPDTFYDIVPGINADRILAGNYDELLQDCIEKDVTLCSIGTRFKRHKQGFLAELMERMFADRARYKAIMMEWKQKLQKVEDQIKEEGETPELKAQKKICENNVAKYNNFQQVKKIQLNAAFGALANGGFRYFDPNLAESITASGQMTIRYVEKKLNDFLNKACETTGVDYVVGVDTDSNYLVLDALVTKVAKPGWGVDEITAWVDKFCEKVLSPYLTKTFKELSDKVNAFRDDVIVMKRENIADVGIFVAKKRYILNVRNGEGVVYKDPKLKVTGIEAVRSSTPDVVREKIKEALKIVMRVEKDNLQEFVAKERERFRGLPFGDLAFPRGLNSMNDYRDRTKIFRKSTPMHVRAALMYNHHLTKLGLENKYPLIHEGDKLKFCYLKMPNPIGQDVIAAPGDRLPEEFGLQQYIDHDRQFDSAFVTPIQNIIDPMGWSAEYRASLEDFFG